MPSTATLWTGSHKPEFCQRTAKPMMLSRRTLAPRKRLPVALGPIVVDSGGFTELAMYGEWRTTEQQYIADIRRIVAETGRVLWVAPQDWMCEPFMLGKTGLDVQRHQSRTLSNYLALRDAAPDIPWIPVLQGWTTSQYHAMADLYESEGVDLTTSPTVGLGSVCRRQATAEIEFIVRSLAKRGYKLHGFGMKTLGLIRCADVLFSADSLAWSYEARRAAPIEGHTHQSCANCLPYMLAWRERTLAKVAEQMLRPHQYPLVAA